MQATPSLLLNTSSVLPPKWNHNKFMGSNLLEYQTIVRKRKQLSDIPFFSGVYRTQWKSNRMDPHWNIPLVDINMFALNIHQSKKKLVVWVVPSLLATANRYLTFFGSILKQNWMGATFWKREQNPISLLLQRCNQQMVIHPLVLRGKNKANTGLTLRISWDIFLFFNLHMWCATKPPQRQPVIFFFCQTAFHMQWRRWRF